MAKLEKTPQFIKGTDLKGESSAIVFKFLDEFIRGGDYNKLNGTIQVIAGEKKFKAKWSCSDKVGNQLIDFFGDDSTEWIGKEIEVKHALINNKDSIIIAQETL